jgi:hypothetical protein
MISQPLRLIGQEPAGAEDATQQTDAINHRQILLHQAYTHLNNFLINGLGRIQIHVVNAWLDVHCFRLAEDGSIEAQITDDMRVRFSHSLTSLKIHPGPYEDNFVL